MAIHVCSLSKLHQTVERIGARHIVTLINASTPVPRPAVVEEHNHLFLGMNDIVGEAEPGQILPAEDHVDALLRFVGTWHKQAWRTTPLLIHCYAGVSRSTAAAFISVCALDPDRDERRLAAQLRERSPTATPNRRLVAIADSRLGRGGRMLAAVDSIGRGADCFEGVPFSLEL